MGSAIFICVFAPEGVFPPSAGAQKVPGPVVRSIPERFVKKPSKPNGRLLQLFNQNQLIRFEILGSDRQVFVGSVTRLAVEHAVPGRYSFRYFERFIGPITGTGASPLRLHRRSDRRNKASCSLHDVLTNCIFDKTFVPNRMQVVRAASYFDLVASPVVFEGDVQRLMDVGDPMPEIFDCEQSVRVWFIRRRDNAEVAQDGGQNAFWC
jgi:hypothetical protein